MVPRAKRHKIGSACQRCRRQKLKCDIQRPCLLCVRAGVDCETVDQWRNFQAPRTNVSRRKGATEVADRRNGSLGWETSNRSLPEQPCSSSTMSLVEGAFHFHDATTPDRSLMTALPGALGPSSSEGSGPNNAYQLGTRPGTSHASDSWLQGPRSILTELISLLPSREVAALLVDTYFDRVHWFMLIFHQDDFRQSWQELYDSPRDQLAEAYPNTGFLCMFLMVLAIALQYTGEYRRQCLQTHRVNHVDLQHRILNVVRSKMLDIVSLGSLETVQFCILLGTFYLYHGNPGLAWPVCGCGLRVAQALNLHRKAPQTSSRDPQLQRQYETRKRCWWAIYEIETFCSMSYGYPPSIKDADCDVEFLDPLAKLSAGRTSTPFNAAHQSSSSLLLYKYLMSKLSVLIKDILTNLYGLGSLKGSPQQAMAGTSSGLQNLIRKVSSFEEKLREWKAERPEFLQLNSSTSGATYNSAEEMDRDVGASGSTFERHIYQLQALALELAYENAMILVHRPLLTYKTTNRMNDDRNSVDDSDHSPLRLSLLACREAALNTSEIETTLVFSLAADTYAAAFIGMHTFTAGVMLCVLTGIEPLSAQSYESKRGIRRLFTMQAHLKSRSRSVVAAQGLEILERLIRLVMEKETKEILTISAPEGFHQPTSQMREARETEQISANNNIASLEDDTGGNAAIDYIQDPNIVQTLYDFDQVLSRSSHQSPLSETLLSETLGPSGAFAQEQAWIWGIDNFAPFPTDS